MSSPSLRHDTGPHSLFVLNYSEWSHTLSARDKYTTSTRIASHFLLMQSLCSFLPIFIIVNILVRTFSLVRSDCYKIKKKMLNISSIQPFWIFDAVAFVAAFCRLEFCNLTHFCHLERNKVNKWACQEVMNGWFSKFEKKKDEKCHAIHFNKPFFIIRECWKWMPIKEVTEILSFIPKNTM